MPLAKGTSGLSAVRSARFARVPFLSYPPSTAFDPAKGELTLLNLTAPHRLPVQWDRPDLPPLWQMEIHYFHWLGPEVGAAGLAYLTDWVRQQRSTAGSAAWSPYAVAMRVLQWTRFLDACRPRSEVRGPRSRVATAESDGLQPILASLYQQARVLARRQEFEFLGNHLIKTAAGLYAAGRFFAGDEADGWERRAAEILLDQAKEQTLADGGHYERSPMYQLLVATDLLDVLNMTIEDSDWRRELATIVEGQLQVVSELRDPAGEIPLTNDSVIGQARTPAEVLEYGERVLGQGERDSPKVRSRLMDRSSDRACSTARPKVITDLGPRTSDLGPASYALPDFGLYRLVSGDWFCWVDAGLPGPDFLLAHAHSDVGSVLAWIGGQRLLVEAGVHCYGGERPRRDYDRNAYGHNVLVLDGHGVCDCWSDFRVGRRVRHVAARLEPNRPHLVVSHDGFRFLPGAPDHVREVAIDAGDLRVTDKVTFHEPRRAGVEIIWHLDPGVQVEQQGRDVRLLAGNRRVDVTVEGDSRIDIERWPVARRFHDSTDSAVLIVRAAIDRAGVVATRFRAGER